MRILITARGRCYCSKVFIEKNAMSQRDFLSERFPGLGAALPRIELASLPTPVDRIAVNTKRGKQHISVKYDNLTGRV